MREQRHPRQIATVVSVDAVGFSKLMHIDEEEALRLFDERRAVIVEAVERAGGNTFGAAGDSIMALFGNPIVALQAVLQFQAAIAEINSAVARDRIMPFRTGISAGQVIIRDDGVFGDTVNIAARVQEFSPHGGIALTETAYLQLQQQFQLTFTDLGPFQLKNISVPVRVFISSAGESGVSTLVEGRGQTGPPAVQGELPALAVLPFKNLTGDPRLDYLCDGIADDILTGVANTRSVPVISRDSSFQFRDPSLTTAAIGHLLGVRYVVTGAVTGDATRLRLDASLADSSNSRVIWTGRFERDFDELLRLQRELGGEIVARLENEFDRVEQIRTFQVPPEALSAWQLVRRGRWHMRRRSSEDTGKAYAYFRQAHNEDPNSSAALNELAWWHLWKSWLNFADSDELKIVASYARRAALMDSLDARSYCYLGFVEILEARPHSAVDLFRQAIDINPSFSLALTGLGSARALLLQPREAIHNLKEAIRLSPFEPYLFHNLGELAAAHTIDGNWPAAIEAANRSLALAPNYFYASYLKAGALARSEHFPEARHEAKLFRTRHPEFERRWIEWIPFKDRSVNDSIIENFQLAGE
ncbi:adenylate/guanylate cyclase domain-containing protein [Pararhizobium qamdonense]|uniref:adenylate/guanylate cyclase domain-containing protein n=1 Tax=Pararhizobium qamdonense TaxID=3031126 RepID=UPI0023E3137D|nr:adenylate/guanylate cyclase domain-containing protein [Pararhizobium qamdonense]